MNKFSKLLIVGSDEVWSIERIYAKHLATEGLDVTIFPAQNIFFRYYYRSILHKIIFRLGLSKIHDKIGEQLLELVDQIRPEVIWVFKGMEIKANIIRQLIAKGIILVNYNPDNPFIFTGRGSGNSNISESSPLYHLHFFYNREIERELKSRYQARTVPLPFGFELDDALVTKAESQEEVLRCCFLGNPDVIRANFLLQLADAGFEIDVYGNDWQRFLKGSKIKIFAPIYKDEFWLTLYKYRVQLNIMRVHNLGSHNMRSFEIPAIGGIQLAPDSVEHREFFENGKEIFLYTDLDSCLVQINHLMSLSKEEASLIRRRARQRSVDNGYSYKRRASEVVDALNQLFQ